MPPMLRPVLALVAVACGHADPAPEPPAHAGTVTEVAGKVTITHEGRSRDARVEDVVELGDVVATGADGHVAIALTTGTLTLEPGTRRQIGDTGPDAKPVLPAAGGGTPADRAALSAIAGKLAACFPTKPTRLTFRIDASHAVMRIAPIGAKLDDASRACVQAAVAPIAFQSASTSITIEL